MVNLLHQRSTLAKASADCQKPNDEKEQERLDLVHHIHRLLVDGNLHRAPIGGNPQRVLDIGTGTQASTLRTFTLI